MISSEFVTERMLCSEFRNKTLAATDLKMIAR
jgi:hypothetical protein